MKLLPRPERLIEQEDFEAMSAYHEDSLQRHQRTTESKKQFRRRIRQMIKKERANGKEIFKNISEYEIFYFRSDVYISKRTAST